jgi:hypothetical protein
MDTPIAQQARDELAQQLLAYWQQRYAAYQAGVDDTPENFLADYELALDATPPPQPALPASVQEAYDYYQHSVEDQDWGTVRLYRVPLAGQPVYVVRVTTDGDDGWLELFDAEGCALDVGRTYLELVAWGDRDLLRAEVQDGTFPPALADRQTQTLWGK